MSNLFQDTPAAGNPANSPEREKPERKRIPMSVPQQKLAVPDVPGFHLHWMLNEADRVAQALRAGYQFVEQGEVKVNNLLLGDDSEKDGSTDLGSQVTVVAGGVNDQGQAVRLVLMKLRLEWWNEDQKLLEGRSDDLVRQLRNGEIDASKVGETSRDRGVRYTREDFFNKRRA